MAPPPTRQFRRSRRLDLDRRRARPVARRARPRAHPRPPLRIIGFEGQRAYGGEIFRLTDHSERLRKSGRPARFRNALVASRRSTPPAARCSPRTAFPTPICARSPGAARSRWALSPGNGPRCTSPSPAGYGTIISTREGGATGLRLDISPWRRPAPYTAPTESKAAGLYMICTLAQQHAEQKGFDDA